MIWWQILLGGVFLGTLNRLLLAVGRLRGRRIRRAATGRYSVAIWVSNRLYRVDWASPETIGVWVGDLFAQGEAALSDGRGLTARAREAVAAYAAGCPGA